MTLTENNLFSSVKIFFWNEKDKKASLDKKYFICIEMSNKALKQRSDHKIGNLFEKTNFHLGCKKILKKICL